MPSLPPLACTKTILATISTFMDETEEEHEEHAEEDHGGLIPAFYAQADAEFEGYEFEFGTQLAIGEGHLTLSLGRDSVEAKFSNGGNVPRIVPDRNFYRLAYQRKGFEVELDIKEVQRQNKLGAGENDYKWIQDGRFSSKAIF